MLVSQKEKLDHTEKTLFKTTCFKFYNKNEEELCIKVIPSRGNGDYLLDSVCCNEAFWQLANRECYPNSASKFQIFLIHKIKTQQRRKAR